MLSGCGMAYFWLLIVVMPTTPDDPFRVPDLDELISNPETELFDVDDTPVAVLGVRAWRCDDVPLTRFPLVSTFEAPRVRSLDAFRRLVIKSRAPRQI